MDTVHSETQNRRLELARRAFRELHSRCFWSYRADLEINEEDIPFVIRELRHNGGHEGYRIVAELCQVTFFRADVSKGNQSTKLEWVYDSAFRFFPIVEGMRRFSRFPGEDLTKHRLVQPLDIKEFKRTLLQATDDAEALFTRLPPAEVVCLYLDSRGQPVCPDPATPMFATLTRHFGSMALRQTCWKAESESHRVARP